MEVRGQLTPLPWKEGRNEGKREKNDDKKEERKVRMEETKRKEGPREKETQ
jgi:hypothetical protein